MYAFFVSLLSQSGFEPHGHSYLWKPEILWLNVGSDAIIALVYYSIPVTLLYFIHKRRDVAFRPMLVMFGAFILLCGTTHVMEIWTVWHGTYRLEGIIKLLTAGASVVMAGVLWPLIPIALALPSATQLEQANQELHRQVMARRRAEHKFWELLEAAPDAMVMVNSQGIIEAANAQVERMFGYARQELLGQSVEVLMPERFRRHHPAHRLQYSANPQVRPMGTGFELYGLRQNGSEFPVEVSLSPIQTEEGMLVASAIRDITERARAQEARQRAHDALEQRVAERTAALQQSNEQLQAEITMRAQREAELARANEALQHSNHELDDFAYIVSHDLKEPLRGLQTCAAILLEDYHAVLDEEGRSKLDSLCRLSTHMEDLIDSLLYYSRVGRDGLALTDTNLDKTVAQVTESLVARLQEDGVEIRLPQPLPTVYCDRVGTRQIFHNLITNAIKYNDKPQKWIEIGVCHGGTRRAEKISQTDPDDSPPGPCVFYVRDNGIGIREKHQDRIFRIFKRLHQRDQYGGGTGIGLAIVKKIVERHHGQLWLESTPGEGTTFYFTLQEEA